MRKVILAALLTVVALSAPWRLMMFSVETLMMRPGVLRTTQSNEHYWDAMSLESRVVALGYTVKYLKQPLYPGRAAYGVTLPAVHLIAIDEALSWDDRYSVLAHEAGHVLQPGYLDYDAGEVFAESVATLVTTNHRFREHARYLASLKGAFIVTVAAEWQAIYHAAAVLEDR